MRSLAQTPDFKELAEDIIRTRPDRLLQIVTLGIPADPKGRYYHWDKLRHLRPPANLSAREWWFAVKTARRNLYRPLPHTDKDGRPFCYAEPDVVRRLLRDVDLRAGLQLHRAEPLANANVRDSYLINSLIEESITSSQLEGAATTRQVAKDMLRENRTPRNRSEQMIANNYAAMQFINDVAGDELTPALVLELHRILTAGTLDRPDAAGRLRQADDIYVSDARDGSIIHTPPRATELPRRLEQLCHYANQTPSDDAAHPVIHAIVLHFLLAYDHPFEDGNGRTARALFYWAMRRHDYWALEFVSISRVLRNAPTQYVRAYLHTETDDNDVTYFIVHQLSVIVQAINELFDYLHRKADEIHHVEDLLRKSPRLLRSLNHRQIALLNRALKKPTAPYYVESHRSAHNITYETARTDLLKLVKLGLLEKSQAGKAFVFTPVKNLAEKLKRSGK